jgi:hypothetical protein
MKKIILWIMICTILIVAFVACGGGGGSKAAPKNLFSLWKEDGTESPLDLTGGAFNTTLPMLFIFTGGEQCHCDMIIIGDQTSGGWSLSSCGYNAGTGTGDPGCSSLNSAGTYSIISNSLSICGGNTPGCDKYH